jgi:alpha-N-arabinofuranosidase
MVLAGDAITAHNTFDHPNRVPPAAFDGAALAGGRLTVQLPPASVVALTLR